MATNNRILNIATALIALWTLVAVTSLVAPNVLSANNARFVSVFLMSVFTLVHGTVRYGLRGIAAFFFIGVLVTNVTENLSIMTGFPFGAYYHTDAMGPKIWHVPLIVGPIFTVAGYLSWMLAGILLGDVFRTGRETLQVARPIVAAFITTSWDFCVDAIGGTINRDWVWADGGPWFGVPWLNFFGWMLTMWIIFQVFSWYASRHVQPRDVDPSSFYWTQIVVYWLLITLQFPLLAVIVPDFSVTDPSGAVWSASDIFQSMALVSVFTMLFTVVLAFALLQHARATR